MRLGAYILGPRLGTGGTGDVFMATRDSAASLPGTAPNVVAIKRLRPAWARDAGAISRLEREASLGPRLRHDNIVRILGHGKNGPEPWLVMEYVPGQTLGALLETARCTGRVLPCRLAVRLIAQVLRGLFWAHAAPDTAPADGAAAEGAGPEAGPAARCAGGATTTHAQSGGILHLDVTPQNILLTQRGIAKIADFGGAQPVGLSAWPERDRIHGKVGYLAPEQLAGSPPNVHADLFGAAIMLWEALCVRRLFRGASALETCRLTERCHVPALRTVRGDVPPTLEAVVYRALAKRPEARYASAASFLRALEGAMPALGTAAPFAHTTVTEGAPR